MKYIARTVVAFLGLITLWLSLTPSAWAVPSFTRRYGVECSRCHSEWGALTPSGLTFRLSGYRAIAGVNLKPESEDIELSHGLLSMPTTLPLSFITGVGYDYRTEKRHSDTGVDTTSKGSTIAVEDASIFLTSPLGDHLSAFVEFPMYETRAWEFTPTGRAEANNTGVGRQIQFGTEKPTFEVAKFFWNNLLGDKAPRDSVNLLFGITQLPLAYPSGKVRLAVNQYLIYERRALDLISPKLVDDVISGHDYLFRMSEAQGLVELFGMAVPHGEVTDVSKKETFWTEYHFGISNGSNDAADNNTKKDLYGRFVMRWYNQSLGLFAYHSPDTYDDKLRADAAITGPNAGIMSGSQAGNSLTRWGPDFTLSLAPFGIPVSLENQIMFNRESDPTGFGTEFKWKGGFHQLNWFMSKETVTYLRYDWIHGDSFDDRAAGGITFADPRESDVVLGAQHLLRQNVKLIGEYRHHKFEDSAIPAGATDKATVTDNGFTVRMMMGF